MTLEEAMYCMASYLPDADVEHCVNCPYRKAVQIDEQTFTCKSSEAHRMAIEALKEQANRA